MAEAVRWAKRGGRVNTISPGIIITPLAADELTGPRGEGYRRMIEQSPAGRAGTPDEVATVAALLLGPDDAFITGSDFLMDGGVTASYFFGELGAEPARRSRPTPQGCSETFLHSRSRVCSGFSSRASRGALSTPERRGRDYYRHPHATAHPRPGRARSPGVARSSESEPGLALPAKGAGLEKGRCRPRLRMPGVAVPSAGERIDGLFARTGTPQPSALPRKEYTEPVALSSTASTSFPPGLAASAYDPQRRLRPNRAPCSVQCRRKR